MLRPSVRPSEGWPRAARPLKRLLKTIGWIGCCGTIGSSLVRHFRSMVPSGPPPPFYLEPRASRQSCYLRFPGYGLTDGCRWRARNGTCTRSAIFIGRRAKAGRLGFGEKTTATSITALAKAAYRFPTAVGPWALLHGMEARRLEVNVPYVCDVGGESGVDSISSTVATRCSSALLLVSKKQRETQNSTSEKPRLSNRSPWAEGRVDPRTRHI